MIKIFNIKVINKIITIALAIHCIHYELNGLACDVDNYMKELTGLFNDDLF